MKPGRYSMAMAILRALVRGRLVMPGGHSPPTGHLVAEGFGLVGVAPPAEPAGLVYLLDSLAALGVTRVRCDISTGDRDGAASMLVEALLGAGYRVMLHLLQSPEDAQRMPDGLVERRWQLFLDETLARFAGRIEMVEMLSTVNRRRWCGYSLQGLLRAWELAHDAARAHGVVLAGPAISDFEPLWNVALLDALRRRNSLPDIHTDNLFVERCTEPEAWDHKVLGRRLAPLLRMNLIKKARLLQAIGAAVGVSDLISPAAFWTLPRIARRLPDSEQKQADYLSRYMSLCAASGALRAVGWGPLICHREGLIDEGEVSYPALERITHYAGFAGSVAHWRRRPAFHAYATFTRLIPGRRYLGALASGAGLEVHRFAGSAMTIDVVWTVNGRAAAMLDLYDEAMLRRACCVDRDGLRRDMPSLATERPVYLCWTAAGEPEISPGLLPGASLLAGVTIHVHGGLEHYYWRDAQWHGMVRAAHRAEADILIDALRPERIAVPDTANSLRHARNAIWTLPDPRPGAAPGARLAVKKPVTHALHKKLLDRLKPSKARRSWSGANELLRHGLATASPVAWVEQISGADLTANWYVCEYLDWPDTVREQFMRLARGESGSAGMAAGRLYSALSRFLLRMHGCGIYFRDLSGGNVLLRKVGEDGVEFALIDTARIRVYPAAVALRLRMADLVRVCHKLDAQGRTTFVQGYLAELGGRVGWVMQARFRLYDLKANNKRWLRKTRFYRWLKR